MIWLESILNAGIDRSYPSSLNKKIILSNQISVLVFLMAILYTGIVYLLLPVIWIYPFVSIFLCVISVYMNHIGMHEQGRFITAITTPLLVYIFHAYLSNPTIGIIDTFYFAMIATMLTGWVLFDIRDKFWFLLTAIVCVFLIVTQNWAIHNFSMELDAEIIFNPIFRVINFSLGIILFVGILFYASKSKVVYEVEKDFFVKNLQAQNEEIQAQNEELLQQQEELETQKDYIEFQSKNFEIKNASLIKSIAAAENVQNTLFFKTNCLQDSGIESFVFHQPKESVSGVFYWTKIIDKSTFVAVIDCGNVGLAGGFISIISYYVLDKIALSSQTNLYDLAKELNEILYKELFYTQKVQLSGIRISLLKYDLVNLNLQVFSAGGCIFSFQNDKVEEIFQDYRIGEKSSFLLTKETIKQIPLSKDLTIYLSTSGYLTQLGAVSKLPFGIELFKEKIQDFGTKDFEDQFEKFRTTFRIWQGYTEQQEDVLLMGLKYIPN